MGRKTIPTYIKEVKGTNRKWRQVENELKPNIDIPSAPDHLSKEALIEWGRASAEYYSMGILSKVDRGSLAAQCEAWALYVEACEIKNRLAEKDPILKGLITKTSNGNIIQNPIIGIINQARKAYMDIVKEYGGTPSSRTRISTSKPKEKESSFSKKFGS